jgi:2-oxoglutarate ferredoxin oxidoreductase subunit delta
MNKKVAAVNGKASHKKTAGKKGKISINKELCKGCKYCVLACPKGLIETAEAVNRQGYFPARSKRGNSCTGCALCAQMCPELAIEVWAE